MIAYSIAGEKKKTFGNSRDRQRCIVFSLYTYLYRIFSPIHTHGWFVSSTDVYSTHPRSVIASKSASVHLAWQALCVSDTGQMTSVLRSRSSHLLGSWRLTWSSLWASFSFQILLWGAKNYFSFFIYILLMSFFFLLKFKCLSFWGLRS